MMDGFSAPYKAAVIGASGGLGGAFTRALAADPECGAVHAFARSGEVPALPKVVPGHVDFDAPETIAQAAEAAGADAPLSLVICATGFLHGEGLMPEKSWKHLSAEALERSFRLNTVGPALVAQHFLPRLPREGRAVMAMLSARVGSISDNKIGGWYGYRAAKAALNQVIKCLAIEASRTRPDWVIVGMQPGTVATPLSEPFRASVPEGGLFAPDDAAGALLGVLARIGPEYSGALIDWRGDVISP